MRLGLLGRWQLFASMCTTVRGMATAPPHTAFDQRVFARLLRSQLLGHHLQHLVTVDSTMKAASAMLEEGPAVPHGAVIVADGQSAGIGRRGRSWDSVQGSSLLFSIVWRLEEAPLPVMLPNLVRLNLAAPVAVACACETVGVSSARIKWPNDVWAGSPRRKLSGVIVDFNGKDAAVLGVGVNVLQDLSASTSATSVATELQGDAPEAREHLRERLLASFCERLEELMRLSTLEVIAQHRSLDLLSDCIVRVHHKSREEDDPRDFDAEALGIDVSGMLRVRRVGSSDEALLNAEEISISPLTKG